ncbi:tyrosine-protein phosphatase [Pseudonocardia sp. WMMC193]|uniref:tyrosine-protein phosphatase n=1 Tax=Pseudonocardia sp. WMMC193 TaxID=2911965 RepID=UPI001F378DD8|nr:tyrosine-protein phosphatase [Pseudonocardia sp. WMMC193]MCF7549701.1 tyrosine-protein phosphatase [Pseudonocardia sp. WMMC193]
MTASLDLTVPANLRDVGGLTTADGRTLRRGVLLRSDAPQPGDVSPVTPGSVIDLRSPRETEGRAHPLTGRAEIHVVALGASLAPDVIAATPAAERDLGWAYRLLVADAAAEIARIVEIVATAPAPMLVHCAAGKDRTGIVIATVLRLVGVPRAQVLADYAATNANLEPLFARLRASGAHLPGVDDDAEALLGVDPAALEAVLDDLESHPGGLRGYLVANGADPAHLDAITARLLG